MPTSVTTRRQQLRQAKRIVVKVGTHLLVNDQGELYQRQINQLVKQLAHAQQQGKQIVLVSSGAIGAGTPLLGRKQRPRKLVDCQLAAAVGQTRLLHQYQRAFSKYDCIISQMLLTHADLKDRSRHLNARNTLLNSLRHHVIPIINENDVVSVDEIQIGDNDTLSALVSALVDADLLILLTTIDGLHCYLESDSKRIDYIAKLTDEHYQYVQQKKQNNLSTGGMRSKLAAAKVATQNNIPVIIADGKKTRIIQQIIHGEDVGTLIDIPVKQRQVGKRKGWIRFFNRPQGQLQLDNGACTALQTHSLLPSGIVSVNGQFSQGALVELLDEQQHVIGHGLTEFASHDITTIQGHHSREINTLLQGQYPTAVIHRDNLILFDDEAE